jgi:hypothetical protein
VRWLLLGGNAIISGRSLAMWRALKDGLAGLREQPDSGLRRRFSTLLCDSLPFFSPQNGLPSSMVPKATVRDEGSILDARLDQWLRCGRCSRCFHKRDARPGGDMLTHCAYEDCDGKLAYSGGTREAVRSRHPEYPEVPERNRSYTGPIPEHGPKCGPCA